MYLSVHAVLYENVWDLISSFGVFGRALSAPKVTFESTSGVFGQALSAPRDVCGSQIYTRGFIPKRLGFNFQLWSLRTSTKCTQSDVWVYLWSLRTSTKMCVDHRSIYSVLYILALESKDASSFGVFGRALSAPKMTFESTSGVFGRVLSRAHPEIVQLGFNFSRWSLWWASERAPTKLTFMLVLVVVANQVSVTRASLVAHTMQQKTRLYFQQCDGELLCAAGDNYAGYCWTLSVMMNSAVQEYS